MNYPILNDIHFPYEDKARYRVALKIMKSLPNIGHIYLNGDITEFLAVSAHPKYPGESVSFCREVEYANAKFDELQKMFPDIPVTYLCGNHEHRFFRYIRDLAPQMWGLTDCPKLFNFPDRPKWKFVDYGPKQIVRCGKSNLYLRHEPRAGGANHALTTAMKSNVDTAYGHTHQYQEATHKTFGVVEKTVRAYSLGWLGDESYNVFDYRGPKDNWVKGMSVVDAEPKSGDYTLDFINMTRLPVIYKGERFDAK